MRAVVVERFGGPDVLELKEIERPEPGPGELLVRVVCAGTNPVDAKLRQFGGGARVSAPVVNLPSSSVRDNGAVDSVNV